MDYNGIIWPRKFGGGEDYYGHYLDFSDDSTGVHIGKILPSCTCFICIAYCMYANFA